MRHSCPVRKHGLIWQENRPKGQAGRRTDTGTGARGPIPSRTQARTDAGTDGVTAAATDTVTGTAATETDTTVDADADADTGADIDMTAGAETATDAVANPPLTRQLREASSVEIVPKRR